MPTKSFSEQAREEEERVEREEAAEQDEADERDREGEPEPEPATPPPPPSPAPPPMSEREVEQGAQRLEKEAERHAKRVREIMGDDFEALLTCPACFTPGFVLPPGAFEPDPEQRLALLALAGVEAEPELRQDPNTVACEACDARGFLATGSKREGYREQSCSKCGGQGWHARELPGQGMPPPAPIYTNGPTFAPAPMPSPGAAPQPYWDVASNSWKLPQMALTVERVCLVVIAVCAVILTIHFL